MHTPASFTEALPKGGGQVEFVNNFVIASRRVPAMEPKASSQAMHSKIIALMNRHHFFETILPGRND